MINSTVLHWAQHRADTTGEQHVLVRNDLGGIDIKHYESVPLVNNPDVLLLVYPKNWAYVDFSDDLTEDLTTIGLAIIIVLSSLALVANFMFKNYISFFAR